MIILDVVLLLTVAGFVFYGIFFGFIRTVGSLLGLVIGLWLAALFYNQAYAIIRSMAFGYDTLGKSLTFFILFTLINRVVVLIFALLDRTFDFFSIIPFLKTINRLAGAVFGLIEGGLLLGFLLYIVQSFAFLAMWIEKIGHGSKIIPYLMKFVEILRPIFPTLLDQLKQLI
jgi:membrane protein required for colicin V production